MALIKNISSEFGVDATYWKIAGLTADFVQGSVEVVLFGYATQEARAANCDPLVKTGASFASVENLDRVNLYALVKSEPSFQGSVDA